VLSPACREQAAELLADYQAGLDAALRAFVHQRPLVGDRCREQSAAALARHASAA
jgi:hypothetical protein